MKHEVGNLGALEQIWNGAKEQLRAQLEQRAPNAVFLEGSIAEGFGNDRSDVDFVALVDDGTRVATMPYIVFVGGRRVEVRLLSVDRLRTELEELMAARRDGLPEASSRISWNKLERCQRFMHCLPIYNPEYIADLQRPMGRPALGQIVSAWFADFARQTGRYAVAMHALDEPETARAWLRTAAFHAAKSYVAQRGEHYLGSKWLALQMERCGVDAAQQSRLRSILFENDTRHAPEVLLRLAAQVIEECEVAGVVADPRNVVVQERKGVTTWQIGQALHVVRDNDVFRLGNAAARAWRRITFNRSCLDLAATCQHAEEAASFKRQLAAFARAGLVSLGWEGDGEIRVRQTGESCPVRSDGGPLLSVDGARLAEGTGSDVQLLPLPAVRFAEAGVNLTWGNIGVENSREDCLGALAKGQWGVLEYTLQRLIQAAALVALAAHGITPQPPLEEATAVAIRLLQVDADTVEKIRSLERCPIPNEAVAKSQLQLASEVVVTLRALSGEASFPASFDDEQGWCETILFGYDWFNLAAHLDAPFPASAAGGRGTAEEARDLLASNLG